MAGEMIWSLVPNAESTVATSPLVPQEDLLDDYGPGDLSDTDIPANLPSCTEDSQRVDPPGSFTSTASWFGPLPASGDASSHSGSYDSSGETSESSDDESDVPLHYSRKYRMTEDYLDGNPLESEFIPYPPETADDDRVDPQGTIDLASCTVDVRDALCERLDVDKDTITYLAEIAVLDMPMQRDRQIDVGHSVREQKMELPILREDHDMQMRRARARNKLELTSRDIEPFSLDVEADEGHVFPQRMHAEVQVLDKAVTDEKWTLSQETMEYLRDLMTMLNKALPEVEYKARPSTVTPPLLPLSPPTTPGIPDGQAMRIEFTSTPEDLIAEDAVAAAEAILAEDADLVNRDKNFGSREGLVQMSDWSMPKSIGAAPSSSSPLGKKRLRNLKLDSPLLPQNSGESPAKKAKKVSFPAELASLIPNPATNASVEDSAQGQAEINDVVQSVIKPFADSVMQEVGSEKLSEVDTTMRVKVPEITAVHTRAPWTEYTNPSDTIAPLEAQRALLQYTKRGLLKDEQKWSGVTKLERTLPWKPFPPHLGKSAADEDFDDGSLERYMSELDLEAEVDPLQLVAQPGVLHILEDRDDDDEDLESFVANANSEEASRAAPREVDDGPARATVPPGEVRIPRGQTSMRDASDHAPVHTESTRLISNELKRKIPPPETMVPLGHTTERRADTPTTTDILREDGLLSFMRLQGRPSVSVKPSATTPTFATASAPPVAVMLPPAPPNQHARLAVPEASPRYDQSMAIVVSPALMANRSQVRALQAAFPKLELIERAPLSGPMEKGKTISAEEGDMILSPSTGLLFTTSQKLKQRPLPGQNDFRGVRERITAVATHFERLLVSVSEGNNSETALGDLDDRDGDALSDLIGFTSSIDCDVQVTYIPGGESDLTGWTAAAIASYGVTDGSITLLQDETLWERFLRKAGLNAFAAQAILGQLKRNTLIADVAVSSAASTRVTREERSGLAAFVCMFVEERVQRFGALLGGDRLLRRVSQAIDAKW
ncbi:hypothetical protein LTR95_013427 [Oleoguttula sp. CCFEE 5521]